MSSLAEARRFALSLPKATESPHFKATSFRVRGKIFATSQDEGHLHVFVGEEARSQALAVHGATVEKLHWGAKVVGLRVDLASAGLALVQDLLRQSWRCKAPKALQAGA